MPAKESCGRLPVPWPVLAVEVEAFIIGIVDSTVGSGLGVIKSNVCVRTSRYHRIANVIHVHETRSEDIAVTEATGDEKLSNIKSVLLVQKGRMKEGHTNESVERILLTDESGQR